MFQAIKPLGLLLAHLPVGPESPGVTAGANFQLPYRASFLLPHHRAARIRFAERWRSLRCSLPVSAPAKGRDVVGEVSAALAGAAAKLSAQVEAL